MYAVKDTRLCCLVLWVLWVRVEGLNMTGEVSLVLVPEGGLLGAKDAPPAVHLVFGQRAPAPRDQPEPRAEEPCLYKYPKKKHFNALLSDMMNELTKIFMRSDEMIREAGRRGSGARFRVVSSKHSPYFDGVYANMTMQFKKFSAKALGKGPGRAGRDPCREQPALRARWAAALGAARAGLRAAATRALRRQLRRAGRQRDSKLKNRLGQFLLKELSRFRSRQLELLCRQHALCYKDLLDYNETHNYD